jgi:hypothetical protein
MNTRDATPNASSSHAAALANVEAFAQHKWEIEISATLTTIVRKANN